MTTLLPDQVVGHPTTPADVAAVRRSRRAVGRRRRTISVVLAALVVAAFLLNVLLGDYTYTVPDFVRIVFGADIPVASYLMMESKLPRALLAVLVGLVLGAGGATFQSVLRNPLASPDVIGVSLGASAGAVVALLVLGVRGPGVSAAALAGAVLTALLVRWVSGGLGGYRLVLVGVGVAAAMVALMQYLFTRAAVWDVQLALRWISGSLNNTGWSAVLVLALAAAVLLPALWLCARQMPAVELGEDAAAGLGVRPVRAELMLLVAVLLIGFGVAAAGPVSFVSFMAGPIARGLNAGRTHLLGAALVGAVIVLCADYTGAYLIGGISMPVGILTGALGAPFLLWMIARGASSGAAR